VFRIRPYLLTLTALLLWSCADSTGVIDGEPDFDFGSLGPSLSVIPSLPAVCGVPTVTRLIADEVVPAGTVEATQDAGHLYVVYRTDPAWPILNTAVYVGASVADIPTSGGGNPRVGKFPYKARHHGEHEVVWEIDLTDAPGDDLVIAAFAQVGEAVEGAWGEGPMISSGGNWSMYFEHRVTRCAAKTVDVSGGTVATPGGEASIEIPAGALPGPLDITIDPATVEDLQEHAGSLQTVGTFSVGQASGAHADAASAGAALELPAVQGGVIPIEGAIWDFGPDGTEFLEPTTVTIAYDEAALPPGVPEEALAIFVIDGIFVAPPSTVDTDANTVSAPIDHFSFIFVGYLPPVEVDLSLEALVLSASSAAKVGATLDFFADVGNVGSEASSGGSVIYQAFGDVTLGGLFGGCTEVSDPIYGDAAISCPVAPLDPDAVDALPAFQLVANVEGDLEIWASVSAAESDVDIESGNNQRMLTVPIGPAVEADLTVSSFALTSGEPKVGSAMEFSTDVTNLGPDATSGGTLSYQVYGSGVALDGVFGDCTEVASPIPGSGDIVVTCPVQPLASGATDGIPVLRIVPGTEQDIEVRASVSMAPGETDADATNNQVELPFTIGPTVVGDLTVSSFALTTGEAKVGTVMEFSTDVMNLGPDATGGGTLSYQVFGSGVSLVAVYGDCTEVPAPIPGTGDIVVTCPVQPLAPGATDGIPVLRIVPGTVQPIEVWASVSMAPGETDDDPTNNQITLPFDVTPAVVGDLTVSSFTLVDGTPTVGTIMEFSTDVMNLGPDATSGGTLSYQVFGSGVTLVDVYGDCTEVAAPIPGTGDIVVTCPVQPLASGATDGIPVLRIVPGTAQSIEVWASVAMAVGETDDDPTNNQIKLPFDVETPAPVGTADLTVPSAGVTPNPVDIGSPVTVSAYVQNLGPDDVFDAKVHYRAFGDVTVGTLSTGCTETAAPEVGDAEVVCPVPPLEVARGGIAVAPTAIFVPQSGGTVTVRVVADAPAADPDPSNDEFVTSFVAGELAELQVVQVTDSRDPVQEDSDVTYSVLVRNNTDTPEDGATLRILFTGGDATFLYGDAGCAEMPGGVQCALGTLTSFNNTPIAITMNLPTGGQTITAEATIEPAAGVTDTNPANNTVSTQTTVVARPPMQIAYGDIIEGALLTPPDTLFFSFDASAGDVVRVQVWMLTALNASTQLIVDDPGGSEIYPDGLPRGRATGSSSAYDVFTAAFTGRYTIKLTPGNGGLYRLGLGSGAGRLDGTFGTDGTGVVKGPRAASPANPMWEGTVDGNAVLAIGEGELRRYDENGEPDSGFGSGGVVDLDAVLGAGRYGQAMVVQPDGKIVVAARQTISPYPWIVARFAANGVLDATFGTGGIVEVPFGAVLNSTPLGIGLQQNGADLDIVVGGHAGTPSANVGIARLNPDGSMDAGFGTGGVVYENGGSGFTAVDMTMQSDGSILLMDNEQIRRYTPSGARDASFGTDGLVVYSGVTTARGLYVQPDDKILVLGDQGGDAFAMRLTADGVLDGTFAGGGLQFYDFGLSERFQGATTDASGNLVVVGRQATPEGDFEFLVTRMSASGVLEHGFATAGYLTELTVDEARWVAIDAAGRIIVGGQAQGSVHGMEITRHIPN
jgi:uncharacterized delta-60 repeat protein